MKIYDCFMYWDEDLILDLRFNILDRHVDKFVIVESNRTWQNNQHIHLVYLVLNLKVNLHPNKKNNHISSSIFPYLF